MIGMRCWRFLLFGLVYYLLKLIWALGMIGLISSAQRCQIAAQKHSTYLGETGQRAHSGRQLASQEFGMAAAPIRQGLLVR